MTEKKYIPSDAETKLMTGIYRAGIATETAVFEAFKNRKRDVIDAWKRMLAEHNERLLKQAKQSNPLDSTVERMTGQQIVKHKIKTPWREESTPSLHIYDDGKWFDFGSGVGGDVVDFVGHYYHGAGYDSAIHFADVIDRLGGLNIAPLPANTTRPAPDPVKQLSIDLETIMDWHETMPANRRDYWLKRGLFDKTIDEFMLGWDGKRYTIPALYRLVPGACKRRQSEIDDGISAKYISVTGSKSMLFNADCLWNTDKVVITEGEIDAMLLTQWGFPAVSTTTGAGTFKAEWAQMFTHVRKVWIMYDNDDAGRKGETLVHSVLRRAKVVRYPDGVKDCGELLEKDSKAVNWLYENLV